MATASLVSSLSACSRSSRVSSLSETENCPGSRPSVLCAGVKKASKADSRTTRRKVSSLKQSTRRRFDPIPGAGFSVRAEVAQDVAETSGSSVQSGLENSFKLPEAIENAAKGGPGRQTLRILVAGGGIGGLVLALAAKKKGLDVKVFERDMSAIKGEGQYRGPIQIQSNALAALEAVDVEAAEEIMANGCVTGDRINGLVDGLTGKWYVKFDTFSPAVDRGLPVTRVISRMTLQSILSKAVGPEILENDCKVVDYEDDGSKVTIILENGRRIEGDVLVGADGIRSKVRSKLLGPSEAVYADFTCYTGIADFVPADIETVGYRVFLGNKQYFVSSDVGAGKMQWYAFYCEPAGGSDVPGGRRDRLLKLFGHWCDGVVDLLLATPEEAILRRDIYDRVPILTWSKGLVTLLGDSAHAMQPNMGQGGCMAIEDSFQLGLDLAKAMDRINQNQFVDIPDVLKRYESERRLRVGAVHGMARMAAIMATTYKAYLGEGLGPLSILQNLRIPHPGRVGGQFFVTIGMPFILSWVLGGNIFALEGRAPRCRLEDKANVNLKKWFADNDALERATCADWFLVPVAERLSTHEELIFGGKNVLRIGASGVDSRPTIIGSEPSNDPNADSAVISAPQVGEQHARIHSVDGAFFITDLQSKSGTWIKHIGGGRFQASPATAVRIYQSDTIEFGPHSEGAFRVKLMKPRQAPPSPAVAAARQ